MGIKWKKSNKVRNIAWVIVLYFITSITFSTMNQYGEYKIMYNPYQTEDFAAKLSLWDNVLTTSLDMVDEEGNFKEEYVNKQIEEKKNQAKEQLDTELNNMENSSMKTDENLKKVVRKNLEDNYKERCEREEKSIRESTESKLKTIKNINDNNKVMLYFIMNKNTNKVLTNVKGADLESFIETDKSKYEFYIQRGDIQHFYEDYDDNGKAIRDILPFSDDVVRIYKIEKGSEPSRGEFLYNLKQDSEKVKDKFSKLLIINSILAALVLGSIMYLYKTRNIWDNDFTILNRIYNKMHIEFRLLAIILPMIYMAFKISTSLHYYTPLSERVQILCMFPGEIQRLSICTVVVGVLGYLLIIDIISNIKEGDFKNYISEGSLLFKMSNTIKEIKPRRSVVINIILSIIWIGIAVFLVWGSFRWFISYLMLHNIIGYSMIIIYILFFIIKQIRIRKCINNIYVASTKIRQGDFNHNIEEKGPEILRDTAKNLNNIKDGLEKAINDATRSEKLKSELITNVSHDLKTPLTSIINYIDLLKDEDTTEEEKKKYIEILDQKSARLKILIEDLFEASKAVSKSVELNMERVDIVSLVRQTLGEFEEKIGKSSLEFITRLPKEKIYVNIDGKKTWRVLENLLSNILKYSMEGSRVYIDVTIEDDEAMVVMKNISAFQMDFTGEDILERFKRGDQSRHTEGSGLGLSIAKSLTELQGGTFNVEIDGDLFKAIVTFKIYMNK